MRIGSLRTKWGLGVSRIVCIEDDEWFLQDMVEALREAGHEVIAALTGEQGLDAIENHHPDLILADMTLPDVSGLDVMNKVRSEDSRFADVPFVIVSGKNEQEAMLESLSAGADEYLTKPIDFNVLLSKVDAMLRQVTRMLERKQDEHVKLYRALTKIALDAAPLTDCVAEIALVGTMPTSMQELRKDLERLGCLVLVFESGQRFIELLDDLDIDVAIISHFTSDMQGELVVRAVGQSRMKRQPSLVLAWPTEQGQMPEKVRKESSSREVVALPTLGIAKKLENWVQPHGESDH